MLTAMAGAGTSAGSLLIAQDGVILFGQGDGFADQTQHIPDTSETCSQLGSISQLSTAKAILILEGQRRPGVRAPIRSEIADSPSASAASGSAGEEREVMAMERCHDIDWPRTFALLAVFIFHCTRLFDTEGWHLKNAEQSDILFILMRALVWPWVMELFFLLSGVGAWHALQSMRAGDLLWERVLRLLIPLYTVGLFLLIPPQFYFDLLTHGEFSGSFWQSIPIYLSTLRLPQLTVSPETLLSAAWSGHIWFLAYLFEISLLTLPLLLYLKSEGGRSLIARLARWSSARGGIFLFVVPLGAALIALRGLFTAQGSWADFVWYAIYFVIGSILAADQRFHGAIKRYGWVCLAVWVAAFTAGIEVLVSVLGYDPLPGRQTYSWLYVAYQVLWSVSSWSVVVFLLSIGARYLNLSHAVLTYANEAVLPFNLLHQTVILIVGSFVIHCNFAVLTKLLIVATVSFSAIAGLYELLVRRFRALRFLFSLRLRGGSQRARGILPATGPAQ
jgi:hypothetical protein